MDEKLKPSDVIEHVSDLNIDILESGIVAPNPSELLMNGRFDEVIQYGRDHYDFVIVDTAPSYAVTDTLLLGHLADLFVYVVRADYLDKRLLDFSKMMYENKRLPNMSILINGTDSDKGYGYGYGYGYGEEVANKSWWKKVFKK
jgi:Mrp family chromosome partitioning ATPase